MSVQGYGPALLRRATVLTFDNLGEASALERGTHDPRAPLGGDPSVTEALPWLLAELDRNRLNATFFVEAINCELYPRALQAIVARGHALGVHGWRHEAWGQLQRSSERELLGRSTRAFREAGLPVASFRPPGGELTPQTRELLREHGYVWYSAAGGVAELRDGLASIPFEWDLVDAYYLMDRFAGLRRQHGDPVRPLSAAALGEHFAARLGDDAPGVQTVILHPFLMLDERWRTEVRRLLARIARLERDQEAWVVSGDALARWLTEPTA